VSDWLTTWNYAHRGLHGPATGFVENSLSAFRAAIQKGYGFELDVLLSKDRSPVVFHDRHLSHLTGQKGNIDDYDTAELQRFKLLGGPDTIPLLTSVLDHTAGRVPVLIEIKGDQECPGEIAAATCAAVGSYAGPVAIMSFEEKIVAWFRDHAPQIRRGLVATAQKPLVSRRRNADAYSPARHIELIERLDADFLAYDIRSLPNDATAYCRDHKIPVLTWTVRTPAQHKQAETFCDAKIFELPT
tara:strand:- start:3210 stop:3941 length:732 start_codon:yes stop_codon:yes gene_type:complete